MSDLKKLLEPVGRYVRTDTDEFETLVAARERLGRRRRAYAAVVALAIVAAASGLALRWLWVEEHSRPADTPPDPGIVANDPIPGGAVRFYLDLQTGEVTEQPIDPPTKAWSNSFDVSPDGTQVALSIPYGPSQRLRVAEVDGSNMRRMGTMGAWIRPGDERPGQWEAMDPRWSPDGSRLVYERGGYGSDGVFVVDVLTNQETRVARGYFAGAIAPPMLPTFTPDGNDVVFSRLRTNDIGWDLWMVSAGGGEPTRLRKGAAGATYSPDGTQVAMLTGLEGQPPYDMLYHASRISLAASDSLDTGTTLVEGTDIGNVRWSPDGSRIAYVDGGTIRIVEVATGTSTVLLEQPPTRVEWTFDWLDAETMLIQKWGVEP